MIIGLYVLGCLNLVFSFVLYTHLIVTLQINQRVAKGQTEALEKIFECIIALATANKNVYERLAKEE